MTAHALCGRVHTDPTAQYFCWAARTWYQDTRPRRTRDEVVTDRVARAKAVTARREFHARRRAEREAKAAKEFNPIRPAA